MARKHSHDDQIVQPEGIDSTFSALTRRDFIRGAGLSGLAATPLGSLAEEPKAADGTPEQIHLTFSEDPATTVVVSWVSSAQSLHPRVILHGAAGKSAVVHGIQRTYTDGLNGQTVFTYHAKLQGLTPGATVRYAVTADNDRNRARPFEASFRTPPRARVPFRWTSYGDLSTPVASWMLSSPQSKYAVQAVERFEPLFHLLNGDLCYANLNHGAQPEVWADFGRTVQPSAAHRPWVPCPGNHEIKFGNGPHGFNSYQTRYTLPTNGTAFEGLWYRF